jgi:hypothetical protein
MISFFSDQQNVVDVYQTFWLGLKVSGENAPTEFAGKHHKNVA